jgi:hypothetical protein
MIDQHRYRNARFLLIVSTLPGCLGLPRHSKHTAQGVKIEVIHPDSGTKVESENKGSGDEQSSKFVCSWKGDRPGSVEIVIEKQRLRVNKRDFGPIASGDSVVIDVTNDFIVEVNEERRQRI